MCQATEEVIAALLLSLVFVQVNEPDVRFGIGGHVSPTYREKKVVIDSMPCRVVANADESLL